MPRDAVTLIGSYLSPDVRKVLVSLCMKQIDYVIDPVVAGFDASARSNPVRQAPVLVDGSLQITDSTVICEYLEECYPQPALYPPTPQMRARARCLEAYAHSRMGEVFVWRLFNERVIKRYVWGEEADSAVVARAMEVHAPQVMDYLEHEFSRARPFLFGEFGIADIAVASYMRNAALAGYAIDAQRWPAMHAFVENALQHPAFTALREFEEISLRTPLGEQRQALEAAGAPVVAAMPIEAARRRGGLAV